MHRLLFLLLLLPAAACDSNLDDEMPTFRFEATGGTFLARTSDPDVIAAVEAELAKPEAERNLHLSGKIARGTAYNTGWSWHIVPNEWSLAELSMELCDGRPDYVEENVDEYVDVIGRYCPWGSRVAAEVE